MDISTVSTALRKSDAGIWTAAAPGTSHAISFPEHGHAECFRIEDGSFWFSHRNDLITAALRRFGLEGPFLDIGAGNGVVSKRLTAEGFETVVLEPGAEGAAHARQRGLEHVVCATLEEADFAAASFGAAGLFDVIEHVEDDVGLLSRTRHVLRPGGHVAVTVPSYEWLWSEEDEQAGHHRRYTIRRLGEVLERAGYEVVWSSYFFAALTLPLFVGRSLPHRLRKQARSAQEIDHRAAGQHLPSPIARRVVDAMLAPERVAFRRGQAIPVGTSCFAIARAR